MSTVDELACTYAALMLADDGVAVTVSMKTDTVLHLLSYVTKSI